MDWTTLAVIFFFCAATLIIVGIWLVRVGKRRGWWGVTSTGGGQPPYYKAHPVKFGLWVFFGIWLLAVGHLAIWGLVVELPKSSINYTRSIMQGSAVPTAPQGKNVGGPLRWSPNATAHVRNRVNREKLSNGSCFAGIIPPGSAVQATYAAYTSNRTGWNAFLIDFTSSKSFLQPEVLRHEGATKEGAPVGILAMPDLASRGRYENRFSNETGLQNANGPQLLECYIQTAGQHPDAVMVEHKEPNDVVQYVVDVGANETSFAIPQGFKWLWIVPVHHCCYQSKLLGNTVPSTGTYYEEALRLVEAAPNVVRSKVQLLGDGYDEKEKFQAVLLEQNGVTSVLSEGVLLGGGNASEGSLSIRLNIPKNQEFSQFVKPAKIIVGIQL